mmetsp:Transcript_38537/g.88366  ORF Transcript_38537/g.88366 Transcript_38537/m.88366 type:complete len:91 (+) Transcript_38537:396-668(+)
MPTGNPSRQSHDDSSHNAMFPLGHPYSCAVGACIERQVYVVDILELGCGHSREHSCAQQLLTCGMRAGHISAQREERWNSSRHPSRLATP